jgi:gliding motility-associated-like protein
MTTTLTPPFAKKLYLFFAFFLVSVFSANASDYYWVGGSGTWSAFSTHWATSSGGSTFYSQIPQSTDNVIFDANSFSTSGQTVTGVDVSVFSLSTTGTVGGTISSMSAVSGRVYTVTDNSVTGDGTMRLDLKSSGTGITDLAGNAIHGGFSVGQVYSIDPTGPVVSSVLVPANATYTLGQNLDFTVNFDKTVLVNTEVGVPYLTIALTGGTVNATYLSGTGSTTLIFRYSVALGDVDLNGITVDNLSLNGGTLKDGAGNDATLTLNSIGNTSAVLVDGGSIITTSVSTLTGFSACVGASSMEQSFTVSGNNLKNNVVVSAAEGFEVSKTTGTGFGSSVSITASGTLAATTIYVRTIAGASGSVSGNISLTSTNAEPKIISASGTVAVISPILGGNSSVNVTVQAIGGGGGANGGWGASGGGGGAAIRTLSLALGDVVNITVGSGGNSGFYFSSIFGGNGGDSKAIFNSINIIGGGGKGAGFGMAGGIATGGTINLIGGAGKNPGEREPGFDGQKQDGYSAAGGGGGNFEDGVNSIINLGGLGGGLAGNGGHGSPQYPISSHGEPGFNYGGGGGGGGNYYGSGGAGGQGVVVITYPGTPIASGGTITQSGGNTTHTFSTSGTDIFTVLSLNSAAVGLGSKLQLSNATAGGTWSTSDTGIATISNTGLVTGIALGTATLSYTVISNGCSNNATISLEVTPLPTISTSDAARAVCSSAASQTTTLNYTGVTGSPVSYSITWNGMPTNSFVAVTDNALSVTPINITVPANTNLGTYTGTITVKNANGTVSAGSTFTLTVTPLPTLTISGTTSISVGNSTTLTASGANTYSWSTGGSQATPLDSTAQSKLAVGLRKLLSSYTGSAVRLRRSTDNVEQDFGFFGSDLDLASITTFLGGVNGYVTKLYDQSGNGNDLIQANNSLQPLFVANGLNGRPILRITADTHERLYNNTNFTPPYTVVYTGKQTGTTRNRLLDGVNNNWLLGWWAGSKGAAYYEGFVNYSNGASDSDAYVYTGTSDGNTSQIYENGTLLTSNSGGLAGPNGISMGSSGEFSDADFTELFIFNSVVSSEDRQLVENSSGGYYGFINPAITTASITVSPTTNTVYTLVGTNAEGCSTSITQLVTVDTNAANTASPASVTPTVCINTELTVITHATTGATGIGTTTGLPAGVTAAWESNTITVSGTPLESGLFSYSIPLTGGYGSVSASGTITVTPAPEVTQPANQVVCNDSSTTIVTFGSVVGTTYSWTNNTASIGLASSGTGNITSFTATNATNTPVVATVTVTPSTSTIRGLAYITNYTSNTVSVINTDDNTLTATVAVGTNPVGVSVSPDGTKVYVTNNGSNDVSVINTADNTVTATVAVGSGPHGISVSPAGTEVYVVNAASNDVSVINTAGNTVTATVAVGNGPRGISVSPDGTKAYVANYSSNTVSVINTADNMVTTVAVGSNPHGVSVSPAGTKVYVTNSSSATVSVINISDNTVTATISVGNTPHGVSVSPDGTKAYVTNQDSNTISVINTADDTVTATVAAGSTPFGVSVSFDGTKAYVTHYSSNTVSVINTADNTVTATVSVGSMPFAFGNFLTSGVAVSCTGASKTFTITVNPTFTAGAASTTPTLYTNTALTPITHTTTGATGIGTAIGLPAGVTADWASNTITISGTPTALGTFNYSIPLTGGCGIVSATGTITALASNNANLSLLALNSGTISPSFAAGITSFMATVSHVTESIKVTPTVDYATATVTVNGTSVTSGSASEVITLSVGSNTISILVTAPDGTTTKTYTVSVTRLKGDQTISFSALPSKTVGDVAYSLTATGGASGNAVSYTSSNTAVATISGSTVTIIGAGTTTITASQAGNANYNAATDVPQTLTVAKAAQRISFVALAGKTFGDAVFNLTASGGSSGNAITYVSSNTAVAIISGSTVTLVGVGSADIIASQAGNANYNAATDVPQTLTVAKAAQSISFVALAGKTFGDAVFNLTASGGSSGNAVSYTSSNTVVATISGSTVTIIGAGTTTITASQAGNANYNAATDVPQTLTVSLSKIDATNILTPNGDGINDEFVIRNITLFPTNKLIIFDRSGRVIYSKVNYKDDWEGTLNGSPLPEGTYYYIFDVGAGLPNYKGFINIVR